jgi:hypothetical protein
MMKVLPSLLVACLLAGCDSSQAPQKADPPETGQLAPRSDPVRTPPAAPTVVLPAPESLVGEYRVAGIDGQPLDADVGIALSIDRTTLSFDPRCAGFVWNYSYLRGRLDLKRAAPLNPPVDGVPAPVCAVAIPPDQRALGKALDSVERAGRSPENGVLLSGGGHSVTLFSQ